MKAARIIDEAVSERVVVFGSPPPSGRDLDLVIRNDQRDSIESALKANGFIARGIGWAAFDGCTTEAVDLVPIGNWGLTDEAIDALFSEAVAIEGYQNLVRPAPHHALLIMAHRVARSGGELEPKKRERMRKALEEDPDGWGNAQKVAAGWGAYRAVIALERLYKTGVPTSRRVRAASLAERSGSRLRAWRTVLKPARGKALVTFSGLDGSGKTSQAEALRSSLERTTGETVIVWTRLSYNPSLKAIAKPIKALLGASKAPAPANKASAASAPDPGKQLRQKSALVTHSWATAVAVANAVAQRKVTRYHLRRGRNVVSDRYTLDSRIHLRYRYGVQRRFAFQAWIIRTLSPKPLRSYLVDVPPQVAYERKPEQYDLKQLETQSRLYDEERHTLEITRLDGTRPKEDLCQEVALDVWQALD